MARITKDTTIGEALQIDAGIVPILMGIGMHCVGCPSSAGQTLEEAAMVHGIDPDMLVEEIQNYLQSIGQKSVVEELAYSIADSLSFGTQHSSTKFAKMLIK